MTEWAYPNPGTPRGRVNSPLHIVRYIMKEQPSFIRSPGGSVGSTLAFLQTISDQTIFCSAVRIPNAPHPFHVFESFQGLLPFVVLDSFMKHFNPQQWVSFQKTHFFVIVLQEITFNHTKLLHVYNTRSTIRYTETKSNTRNDHNANSRNYPRLPFHRCSYFLFSYSMLL